MAAKTAKKSAAKGFRLNAPKQITYIVVCALALVGLILACVGKFWTLGALGIVGVLALVIAFVGLALANYLKDL